MFRQLIIAASLLTPFEVQANDAECTIGVYEGETTTLVSYDRPQRGGGTAPFFQFENGERGFHGSETGVSCSGQGKITTPKGVFTYRPLMETDTTFKSGSLTLAGRLIEPKRKEGHDKPLVVYVHGSERTAAVGGAYYPYMLAAQGISVFVYDKRGTGASEGSYSQNFHLLAGDAIAASKEARRLAAGRFDTFGMFGGSQGGWVAPLAANETGAEFLVIGFGLVLQPLEENAEQVTLEMRQMGYGEREIAQAREVTDAVGNLVANKFETGYAELEAVKRRYVNEPWFSKIRGEYTKNILEADDEQMRRIAKISEELGVPWRHDPIAVLRDINVPQLWVIAGADREAPSELTKQRLEMLQSEGLPITTALFPNTDHGMVEFVEEEDGTRRYTRITEGYFPLITDYMKGVSAGNYGAAQMTRPPE